MTAPLVLAKTGDWTQTPPTTEPEPASTANMLWIGAGAAGFGIVFAWIVYRQSLLNDKLRESQESNDGQLAASFQRLVDADIESPREAIERMARERAGDE